MNIQKNYSAVTTLVAVFLLLNAGNVFAQFTGSLTLSGYRSTNVEGRDSTTPDNTFNPSLDLLYNWSLSDPNSIKFEATVTPNIYTQLNSRSFTKSYFGATGSFYLSNIEDGTKGENPTVALKSQLPNKTTSELPKQPLLVDTIKPVITIKPAALDLAQIASLKLAVLSELLDSFDIDKKGLSSDSTDIASDLKDSVSESVLALSDILASQVFTESISDVVTNELAKLKRIFLQVPMETTHKSEIFKNLEDIIDLLKGGKPQSDILPVPKPSTNIETPAPVSPTTPSSPTNDLITQALAHLQDGEKETTVLSTSNAPIITLVNPQTSFNELSSQDMLLKEDLVPVTKKTLATLLSVPITLEMQTNKDAYKVYSYSTFEFKPRLDYYFSSKASLGATYDLSNTKFPYDTVYEGTENKIRFDSRFEITQGIVFAGELGMGFRTFAHPLQYQVQTTKRVIKTGAGFSHFIFGAAVVFFPTDRLNIGIAAGLTRSSKLRPYLVDLISSRSSIGGSANDDSYSYELTRESIFSLWRIFWDINFTLDISYENRKYADISIPGRLAARLQLPTGPRTDQGPQFGLNLSKEFLFDNRLVSIFNSFTPVFDIQSSKYTSTQPTFSYKDVTTTLSFEFGF